MNKSLTNKLVIFAFLACTSLGYVSCQPDRVLKDAVLNLPSTPFDYTNVKIPDGFIDLSSKLSNGLGDKKKINDEATLGRVLFYDKLLSINNSVSCGSCHNQKLGFADGAQFSTGFASKKTHRNTLSLANTLDELALFWDSRAADAEELSLMPVFDHLEMGMESEEMLVAKVSKAEYYAPLFNQAYGSTEITKDKITTAIATFLNTLVSKNSKFDAGKLNPEEALGLNLFQDKALCMNCHTLGVPQRNSGGYNNHFSPIRGTANIGLDKIYADQGVGGGSFRIPNLRNISLTGPYMHDGRYTSLEQVIEHYNSGVRDNAQLDPIFRNVNGSIKKLNLTQVEKKALVAFLGTLTDDSFIADPKFSNPFN